MIKYIFDKSSEENCILIDAPDHSFLYRFNTVTGRLELLMGAKEEKPKIPWKLSTARDRVYIDSGDPTVYWGFTYKNYLYLTYLAKEECTN